MDLTRHSFTTTGSFSAAGGGGGGGGSGANNSGWDAVQRAMAVANGTVDHSTYGGGDGTMRSHHSSRAASLSSSKHGDMIGGAPGGPGGPGGSLSNGKHEHAWGWGHNSAAGGGGNSATEQQHRARSIAHVFGQAPSSRQSSVPMQASAAEAVTPSVGRAGSGYGFKGPGGGGGVLGAPAGSEKSAMPESGQPRSRRWGNQQKQQQQQGWESGVVETKSEEPRYY